MTEKGSPREDAVEFLHELVLGRVDGAGVAKSHLSLRVRAAVHLSPMTIAQLDSDRTFEDRRIEIEELRQEAIDAVDQSPAS